MTLRVRDTGALRTATEAYFRSSTGSHPIDRMSIRGASGVSEFYRRGIRAAASPEELYGFSRTRTGPVVSNTVVVSVSGGTGPYSHSWSSGGGIFATNPSLSTTAFRGTPRVNSGELNAILTDTITDANGLTSQVVVSVNLVRES